MSKEEIRKLLGGYATNTLSPSERNALFEAALDDQELFNALQEEQALQALLQNPEARAEVRQALENRSSDRAGAGRMRWWAWGGALGAVAAAAVLFAVFRPHPSPIADQRVEIASAEKVPPPPTAAGQNEPQREATAPSRQEERASAKAAPRKTGVQNSRVVAPSAAPSPIIPQPVQTQAAQTAVPPANALKDNVSTAGAQRQQLAGGEPRTAAESRDQLALAYAPAASLTYSVLKRDPSTQAFTPVSGTGLRLGDLVRFRVSPPTAGRLILSSLNDSGQAQPLSEMDVQANSAYTIPDAPIPATLAPQRFRLTLLPPNPAPETVGSIAGAGGAMRTMSAPQAKAAGPPSLEITVVAKP